MINTVAIIDKVQTSVFYWSAFSIQHVFLSRAMGKQVPHGQGRMALQRALRAERSKWLAKELHQRLNLDDVQKRMVIIPNSCNLRKRKWRRSFGFLSSLEGRIYTDRLCQAALRRLIRMLPYQLHIDPKYKSVGEFIQAQGSLLRKVARQAKRMGKAIEAGPQPLMSYMNIADKYHLVKVASSIFGKRTRWQ